MSRPYASGVALVAAVDTNAGEVTRECRRGEPPHHRHPRGERTMDDRDLIERARIVRLLQRMIADHQRVAHGTHYTRSRDARAVIAALTTAVEAIEAGEHHGVSDAA